jgi:hypothetical protein
MKRINKKSLIFPLLIFILTQICLFNANPVKAAVLDVQIKTDRQTYNVGDPVLITANATLDGNPYSTVIAIEVINPYGNTLLLRTIKTGDVSGSYWKVIITDLFLCDSNGNPKTTFKRETLAYASYTIKNIDVVDHEIKIAFYIQCSDNTPMLAYYAFEGVIEAGKQMSTIASFPIPNSAPQGEAKIFLGVFNNSPKNGGTPYCPERSAIFYIESTTPPFPTQPETFNISFSLPKKDLKLGNYTVYGAAKYYVQTSFESKKFQVVFLGDIVNDGIINMRDITACILLFQTTPSSPNWNPDADVDKSGKVDMRDVTFLILHFGCTAIS